MKKKWATVLTASAICFIAIASLLSCSGKEHSNLTFNAGSYTASAKGNYGQVPVTVTFSKNKISKIVVGENSETPGIGGSAMETLSNEILEGQTLAVDVVTGATNSSKAFLSAVEECAKQAGGDMTALKATVADNEGPGEKITKEVDIIVVGGGGAGLAAAVSASEEGASVILIEKSSALGGNTLRAGGAYNAVDPQRQKNVEMTGPLLEDLKSFLDIQPSDTGDFAPTLITLQNQIRTYLEGDTTKLFDSVELHMMQTYIGGHRVSLDGKEISGNVDLVRELCEGAPVSIDWLADHGLVWTDKISTVLGALWPRTHAATSKVGAGYIEKLSLSCEEMGVEIMLETRAMHLIKEGNRIVGVLAEQPNGTPVELKAKKGVILATGGYGANPSMIAQYNSYWPVIPETMKTTNTKNATGDGITMGLEIGSNLVGMGFVQLMPSSHPETGELSGGIWGSAESQVFVNKEGHRFVNEYAERDVLASAALSQSESLFYIICDQETAGNPQPGDRNVWGDDIDTLIQTHSIYKADTLEDLAQQLDMPESALTKEIEKYNSFIENGIDPEFGKRNFGPTISTPPFYATPRSPSVHHTMGGLQIDTKTHVIDENGNIIKGLYAAGEITGGIHAGNRLGGNAFADIMTFGRIAGTSAAQEL